MPRPLSPKNQAMRDAIMAALAEHGPLNTTALGKAIGYVAQELRSGKYSQRCDRCEDEGGMRWHELDPHPSLSPDLRARRNPHDGLAYRRVMSMDVQPALTALERRGWIVRDRQHTSDLWTWALGPEAPASIDLADLEALL